MTYEEFKTYVLDFVWRKNDQELINNLDNIIRMANSELNRKLNIQRREVSTEISPQSGDYELPTDFYQMRSITNLQPDRQARRSDMRNTTFAEIQRMRAADTGNYVAPYYFVRRSAGANTLFLVGPFSATNPGNFSLEYRTTVPDFAVEDESWVEADYLDLYLYVVLKHVGVWLREDDRVASYDALLTDALGSTLDEDKREVQFGGSPLHMKPNRPVPQTRRR